MPIVSIIVPVFNAEKYLHECINSVLLQTYQDWELLLIDDGSTDSSGLICDDYALKDERIRVFHIQNGGVSKARNYALDIMQGQWLTFLDSDDYIAPQTLEFCLNQIQECGLDMVQYSYTNNSEYLGQNGMLYTDTVCLEEYIKLWQFQVGIAGNFVPTSVIKKYNIRFDESLKIAEDQIFIMTVMTHLRRFKMCSEQFYYWRVNNQSATHTASPETLYHSIAALAKFKNDMYPLFSEHLTCQILKHYLECRKVGGNISTKKIISLIIKTPLCNTYSPLHTFRVYARSLYWILKAM